MDNCTLHDIELLEYLLVVLRCQSLLLFVNAGVSIEKLREISEIEYTSVRER